METKVALRNRADWPKQYSLICDWSKLKSWLVYWLNLLRRCIKWFWHRVPKERVAVPLLLKIKFLKIVSAYHFVSINLYYCLFHVNIHEKLRVCRFTVGPEYSWQCRSHINFSWQCLFKWKQQRRSLFADKTLLLCNVCVIWLFFYTYFLSTMQTQFSDLHKHFRLFSQACNFNFARKRICRDFLRRP